MWLYFTSTCIKLRKNVAIKCSRKYTIFLESFLRLFQVVQGPTSEKVYTDLPKQMEEVITGAWSNKPMKSPRGTPDII